MATATAPETKTETCGLGLKDAAPVVAPLTVTERAAEEVRRYVEDMRANGSVEADGKLYLRVRVQGGGCSGFQNKLDLDAKYDEKTDHLLTFHGIEVVVDKRSMLYLTGAVVDYHNDLNKKGFTVTNPQAKGTCGCGSSYSM
jgi:iron-sulfur cluster assembly accessory protein